MLETMYSRQHKQPHNTKWSVKQLSGDNVGAVTLFTTEEDANLECFYLADNSNVCAIKMPPKFYND